MTKSTPPSALSIAGTNPSTVTWKAFTSSDRAQTIVRLVPGDGSRATPTSGIALADGAATSAPLPRLQPGIRYVVAAFAIDTTGNASVASLVPVNVVAPTAELLPDAGFELGTGGWKSTSTAGLRGVTSPKRTGSAALAVTATSGSTGFVGMTQKTAVRASVASQGYTASCWVRPTKANLTVQLRLVEYTPDYSASTRLATTTARALPANDWTKVEMTALAKKSGMRMVPQIFSTNQTTTSGDVFYDDCSLQRR